MLIVRRTTNILTSKSNGDRGLTLKSVSQQLFFILLIAVYISAAYMINESKKGGGEDMDLNQKQAKTMQHYTDSADEYRNLLSKKAATVKKKLDQLNNDDSLEALKQKYDSEYRDLRNKIVMLEGGQQLMLNLGLTEDNVKDIKRKVA